MTEAVVRGKSETDSPALRILRRLIDVSPAELPALGWCWLYIFSVLASYYILRPIRDQMGVAGGVNNLPWLFTGTLVIMLLLNVPFSALVKLLPRRQFISLTYRFFALSILAFGAAMYAVPAEHVVWVGRFFFIWISVFNLFVVSIFWSMVVDIFSPEQGKRLFGFIAAGATVGAIVGSSVTAYFAAMVHPAVLLVGAALLLEVATFCVRRLSRLSTKMSDRPHAEREEEPIGGGVMAGFIDAVRSPYLLNTAIFLLLYAITSTFLYFSQASVVAASFTDRAAQTTFFATIDLVVNAITLVIQVFLTGRLVGWLGIATVLSLLPAVSILGFGTIYALPTLAAVAAFQIARRAGNFALTQPARQVLYTVVSREDRYKTKNFIDTAIYRAGDQVGAWSYALIGAVGWGIKQAGIVAVVVSALWLVNSVWLGRRQEELAKEQERQSEGPATSGDQPAMAASSQARAL
jgi:ATP:ADP antiporter, AAA family